MKPKVMSRAGSLGGGLRSCPLAVRSHPARILSCEAVGLSRARPAQAIGYRLGERLLPDPVNQNATPDKAGFASRLLAVDYYGPSSEPKRQ